MLPRAPTSFPGSLASPPRPPTRRRREPFPDVVAMFPNDAACARYLEVLRWPSGFRCAKCGFQFFAFLATQEGGGISRGLILAEALIEGTRGRNADRRARGIELARWAGQEAERGVMALVGNFLEPAYGDLGRRRGNAAEIEARRERRKSLRSSARWGAWWLARRLRTERDVEVLADAASVLADLGRAAVAPVTGELRLAWPDGPPEQVEALLGALRWLEADDAVSVESVVKALGPWLRHSDADLRERAVLATRALPREDAARLLRAAEEAEPDATLCGLIAQELSDRAAESSAPGPV